MTELQTKSGVLSITDILAERGKTHGAYADVAATAQRLKAVIRNTPNWHRLNPGQTESLEMQCMKWARILCGDPNEPDHWKDCAGYATLGGESVDPKPEPWLDNWRRDQEAR